MAKKNKIDLKDFSVDELYEQLEESEVRLQKTRFNHAIAVVEDPNVIRILKKDIARYKTEIRSRELAEQ